MIIPGNGPLLTITNIKTITITIRRDYINTYILNLSIHVLYVQNLNISGQLFMPHLACFMLHIAETIHRRRFLLVHGFRGSTSSGSGGHVW